MEYRNLATSLLIARCVARDLLAWAEFVKRFSGLITFAIKRALLKYSSNGTAGREETEDIRQNIMAFLWSGNKLNEIKNKENIDYWLAITARNATISRLRAKRKELLVSDKRYFEKIPAKETEGQIAKIEAGESDKKIKKIYASLTPREKLMFKLYFEKNLGLKDVSKIMCLRLGTVSSAITRMRKKIKCSKF